MTYSGRLIIDDPTEMNVVIPSAPARGCSSRGCNASLVYSTDGGNTFHGMYYIEGSQLPAKDSEDYTIAVTKDSFFVAKKVSDTTGLVVTDKYPLLPGHVYGEGKDLPEGKRVEFNVKMPLSLRTPSGQDRFVCDIGAPDGASKK
ncbi:hypothetical protein [Paraburkholderia sp. SIMBA_030]|uniref:T6SS immunity protein Tli3 family protein n=2 Tax=Bacteria TaxID=2 RepID=UPI00397E4629